MALSIKNTTATPPFTLVGNALLASAKRLTGGDKSRRASSFGKSQSNGSAWQTEAWEYYDLVGELHFMVNTLAGQLSRAHLYVEHTPVGGEAYRVTDPKVTDILEALGDTSKLLNRLALNLYIAGEGWLAGIPAKDPETNLRGSLDGADLFEMEWYILSVSEVTTDNQGKVTLKLDSDETLERDIDDVFLIRIWNGHPRYSWQADSSVRSALPILNELVKLTMHVSAQADSRLAGAGMLIVPQSAQQAMRPKDYMDALSFDEDYFTESLITAMSTAVSDRSSAAAIVPVVATVPDDSADKFKHISFATPLDAEASALREEAIRRLALSMDAPPEILLGTSSMNHWGGWLVKEETVATHLEAPLTRITEALTSQYLKVVLRGMGYSGADLSSYAIRYDVDHLLTRPNMSADAKDLYSAGVLTEGALRRAVGFDESDAPEKPMSLARATVLRMVENDPELLREPGVPALLEEVSSLIAGSDAPANPADETNTSPDTSGALPEVEENPNPSSWSGGELNG